MASSLIGNEILPNVYIDNIKVYDDNLIFNTYIFDNFANPVWSENDVSKNSMKIKMICSFDDELSQTITNGLYEKVENISASNNDVVSETRLLSFGKQTHITDSEHRFSDHLVFKQQYKVKITKNTKDLTIFAFLYLKTKMPMSKQNIKLSIVRGPITSERILNNSKTISESHYFVNNRTKEAYNGPVHYSNALGWMVGSKHSQTTHDGLERKTIPNYKIKDLRNKKYMKKIKEQRLYSNISDTLLSFDQKATVNGVFFINLADILKQYTKYGFLFAAANDDLITEMVNKIKIKSISLYRDKIKSFMKTTFIGTKVESRRILLESKKLCTAVQKPGGILEKVSGMALDFRTLNLQLQKYMLGIDFVDKESNKLNGKYQYHLEMIINDPTIDISYSFFKDLENISEELNKYFMFISKEKYYDLVFDKPKTSISSVFGDVENMIGRIVKQYVKYKSFLYSFTNAQKKQIEYSLVPLIHPKTCSIETVQYFINLLSDLQKEADRAFTHSFARISGSRQKEKRPKSEKYKNSIFIKHQFKSIFRPHENRKFYNYLQPKDQTNIKVLTSEDFLKRISSEKAKFFIKQPNFSEHHTGTRLSRLSDIDTSGATFFSPFSLGTAKKLIPTAKLDKINIIKFNEFFYNYETYFPGISVTDSDLINNATQPQFGTSQNGEEADNFVDAVNYLGTDSSFDTFDQEEDYCNINSETIPFTSTQQYLQSDSSGLQNLSINPDTEGSFFDQYSSENIPIQTIAAAALIMSNITGVPRSSITANVTWNDCLHIQTLLFTVVNFFKLNQIEILVGFQTNNKNEVFLNQPFWRKIRANDLQRVGNGTLLRQVPIKNNYINSIANRTKHAELSYSDKYFIISDFNIEKSALLSPDDPLKILGYPEIGSLDNSVFLTNNIIKQTNRSPEDLFSVAPVQFSFAKESSTATAVERFSPSAEPGLSLDADGDIIGEY